MTDKQIIETFYNIKEYCDINDDCSGCPYYVENIYGHKYCQIKRLALSLNTIPKKWDMEEIERIIYETD